MSRHLKPFALVIVLMAATSLALLYTVDVTLVDEPGVRMELPATLGDWTGRELRFCHDANCKKEFRLDELKGDTAKCPECGGPLFKMSLEEYEQLPKDTEFIKSTYLNSASNSVFISVVLTGRDRESIHRPERCLEGQGHKIQHRKVLGVPLAGREPIVVSVLLNNKVVETRQGPVEYRSYYAYWFVGQNRETHSHWWRMFYLAWDRVVHSVAHRWAYISVAAPYDPHSDAYEAEIREIVSLVHQAIVLTPEEIAARKAKKARPPAP